MADPMRTTVRSLREAHPGPTWLGRYRELRPDYVRWFLREGTDRRPDRAVSRAALVHHMPELVPTWSALLELAGDDDLDARLLSLYRPSPFLAACSQAVWTGDGGPFLVRNYDYDPRLYEATILMSSWNGVRTIVQSDCMWGALDGMNEYGLVASLAFGGSPVVGDGFGIPLIVRYVLETCRHATEARAALARVPSHMAYNVTVLDRDGECFTAELAPGRATRITETPFATNHQHLGERWERYDTAVASQTRWELLRDRLADDAVSADEFTRRFSEPPLYSDRFGDGFGTLYTAVYRPRDGSIDYRWPGGEVHHSFDWYDEGELPAEYPMSTSAAAS